MVILALAGVMALGLVGVDYYKKHKKIQPTVSPSPVYSTEQLSLSDVQGLLPAKIPLEQSAQILQSYRIIGGDGTEQITYQFITKKTLEENFSLYKTYLENNGWKIQNTINETDIKTLIAIKEQETINITISRNTISNQNIVDISLTSKMNVAGNVAVVEKTLLLKAKISLPEISQREEINKIELPSLLQQFILQESGDLSIERISYVDQRAGFYVVFNLLDVSMRDLASKLGNIARGSQWQPLAGSRAAVFGFLEYEKGQYQVRIIYTQRDLNNIEVILQVIENK